MMKAARTVRCARGIMRRFAVVCRLPLLFPVLWILLSIPLLMLGAIAMMAA